MKSAPKIMVYCAAISALLVPIAAQASTVRAGDHVQVTVYNHPELSGEVIVSSDGIIAVPLAGQISAAGQEQSAVASRIEQSLKKYLRNPAVSVELKSEGSAIAVSGWPYPITDGVVKYIPGQTLSGLIAQIRRVDTQTGTFNPYHSRIDMSAVRVERDGKPLGVFDMVALNSKGESGPALRPGDSVRFVDKPIAVRVSGDVVQPGFAYLAKDEPLSNALDQVGGLSTNAATAHLTLTRNGQEQVVSLADIDMSRPATMGDTLFVPTAPEITVAGTVLKPGTVMLKSDFSLLSAIFNAGGPDKTGDLGNVRVIHGGNTKSYDVTLVTRGDMSQNPQLHDGDQVYVPQGRKIDNGVFANMITTLRYVLRPF